MKIAVIGIRGIPVVYSGYETFTEILATELVLKNHEVTVYCRSPYVKIFKSKYRGVNLTILPTIKSKNFDTLFHSFISTIHACFSDYDVILYLSVGNSIFSIIPRLFGKKTAVNVDGLDWKRKKWGFLAKKFLFFSEYLAGIFPNVIITDSLFIKEYYRKKYKKESTYIPYGGFVRSGGNYHKILKKYDLKDEQYFIWNGRIVPDNHIEDLVFAYGKLNTDYKCVILGDDLYKSPYKQKLHKLAKRDKRIIFTGFISHDIAAVLVKHSFAYIETKRSGGTHPSLVEAMSVGSLIISNNCRTNRDVLGKNVIYYDMKKGAKDLADQMSHVLEPTFGKERSRLKINIKTKANQCFGWKNIITEYEKLFLNIK